MPRIARDDQTNVVKYAQMPGYEGHQMEADGYVVAFEKYETGVDFTPLYRGLPDDLCPGYHWGYVISGQLIMHRPEGDEVYSAGDAFLITPGHTPEVGDNTEFVEFTPTDVVARIEEVIRRNVQSDVT